MPQEVSVFGPDPKAVRLLEQFNSLLRELNNKLGVLEVNVRALGSRMDDIENQIEEVGHAVSDVWAAHFQKEDPP
jgi:hypothetical protein